MLEPPEEDGGTKGVPQSAGAWEPGSLPRYSEDPTALAAEDGESLDPEGLTPPAPRTAMPGREGTRGTVRGGAPSPWWSLTHPSSLQST